MELDPEAAYATACLFTLALHDAWRAGPNAVEGPPEDLLPWGVPLEPPEALPRASPYSNFIQEWDCLGSGWDLAGPGGLLERVWAGLGIPRRKWQGLKELPLVARGGGRTPMEVVRSFVGALDDELAAVLTAALRRPPPPQQQQEGASGGAGQEAATDTCGEPPSAPPKGCPSSSSLETTPTARLVRDDLFRGLLLSSSDDSDWEEDLRREQHQHNSLAGGGAAPAGGGQGGERHSDALPQREGQQPGSDAEGAGAAYQQAEAPGQTAEPAELEGDRSSPMPSQPAAESASVEEEEHSPSTAPAAADRIAPRPVSPHALGALWELVQCCVGAEPVLASHAGEAEREGSDKVAEEREGSAQGGPDRHGSGKAEAVGGAVQQERGELDVAAASEAASDAGGSNAAGADKAGGKGLQRPPPPQVRWYDARARVALKQVAAWLQVPWRKVANFELLLANEKAPADNKEAGSTAASKAEPSAWEQRLRWVKVGAAAVGGGALFAVTGGLAAPALAAGLGSVLSMVGPSTAAVAGVVSGFTTSTAGVAAVAGTMGAAGAARTGGGMAYRTAEVSEFGFRELTDTDGRAAAGGGQPAPAGDAAEDAAGGLAAGATRSMAAEAQQQQGGAPVVDVGTPGGPRAQPGEEPAQELGAHGDGGHLLCSPAAATRRAPARQSRESSGGNSLPDKALASASSSSSNLGKGTGSAEPPKGSDASPAPTAASTAGLLSPGAPPSQGAPSFPAEPGAWQRWFGRKQGPPPLLPVPLRVRRGGDVRLAALICVSGWITAPSDYVTQWQSVRAPDADQFCLVWESRELLALNSALGSLVAKQAASQGAQFAVQHFLYAGAGLVSALAPALLLDTASSLLIQNAWSVSLQRAAKAGKLLAHVLMGGGHGDRPVTLVGHSMGARLIFHALAELARHDCRGVVQDVVLLGAPVGAEPELRWHMARRVVAGRLINAYSRRDWLLGVVFGGSSGWVRAASGLCPVEMEGVENVNLSALVSGHFEYLGPQVQELFDSMALFQ